MRLGHNANEIKKNLHELKKHGNCRTYAQKNYKKNNYKANNYNTKFSAFHFTLNNENIYPRSSNSIKRYNNMKLNNNINDEKYLNLIGEYNILIEEYKINKNNLQNLQQELESRKGLLNKFREINNKYIDLQNRNKDLVIIIQKKKNNNSMLTMHIEDLNRKKKI